MDNSLLLKSKREFLRKVLFNNLNEESYES